MKRLLSLSLLASLATGMAAAGTDGNITVEIRNIRNGKGNILVMAQADEHSKPIYGLAKITGHTARTVLESTGTKEYILSAFHDENGNWKLDTDERGMPVEGFARKTHRTDNHKPCVLKLYYPENEEL